MRRSLLGLAVAALLLLSCGKSEEGEETDPLLCGGCGDPAKPACDEGSLSCVSCLDDEDCEKQNTGLSACLRGATAQQNRCVACTPESESKTCGENACDPATNECTTTIRGALATCQPCRTDSECKSDGNRVRRCVPILFRGMPDGNYCAIDRSREPANRCPHGFAREAMRVSANGVESLFCLHREDLNRCSVIAAFGRPCGGFFPSVCPVSGDGQSHCTARGVFPLAVGRCSYICQNANECPGNRCDGDSNSPTPICDPA